MNTYADLDQLKAAFAVHASHLRLAFTGSADIHVIPTNRPEGPPIAIIRAIGGPDDSPRPPGSPAFWRVHTIRTGVSICEGPAAGVATWLALPIAGLYLQ
jgi:hypothetical protein